MVIYYLYLKIVNLNVWQQNNNIFYKLTNPVSKQWTLCSSKQILNCLLLEARTLLIHIRNKSSTDYSLRQVVNWLLSKEVLNKQITETGTQLTTLRLKYSADNSFEHVLSWVLLDTNTKLATLEASNRTSEYSRNYSTHAFHSLWLRGHNVGT